MDFKEFENLLGKDISHASPIFLGEGFEQKGLLGVNIYTSESYKWFYGIPYNMVSIMTDENNIIKDVVIHFHTIIDKSFYDSFVLNYGNPDTIQVVDGHHSAGKWSKTDTEAEFDLRVRKVTLKMREGKFEETPLFMIWKKKDYEIKIFIKLNQNTSEITFRIPTNEF